MHRHEMLADGAQVMIAVSGGMDSLVLCWALNHWRRKAPIRYNLLAVHIDNGFEPPKNYQPGAALVAGQLEKLSIPCFIMTNPCPAMGRWYSSKTLTMPHKIN